MHDKEADGDRQYRRIWDFETAEIYIVLKSLSRC